MKLNPLHSDGFELIVRSSKLHMLYFILHIFVLKMIFTQKTHRMTNACICEQFLLNRIFYLFIDVKLSRFKQKFDKICVPLANSHMEAGHSFGVLQVEKHRHVDLRSIEVRPITMLLYSVQTDSFNGGIMVRKIN